MNNEARFISVEYLPQAIDRVNKMHAWINDNIKDIRAIVHKARIIKNGTDIDKRSKEALEPYYKACKDESHASMWLNFSYSSITLNISMTVSDSKCTCIYVKESIGLTEKTQYLYDKCEYKWEKMEIYKKLIYDINEVRYHMATYKQTIEEIRELEDKASNHLRMIRSFQTN